MYHLVRAVVLTLCLAVAAKAETVMSIGRPHTCTDEYPADAMAGGHVGIVTMRFTITTEGTVADPVVDTSSGFAELDQAALSCVVKWRYKPAMQDGKPIAVIWKAQVRFMMPSPEEIALQRARGAVTMEAWRCLATSDGVKKAPPGFSGMTQLVLHVPMKGAASISLRASSGDAALDRLAQECFRTSPSIAQLQALQTADHDYDYMVPWVTVLNSPPPPAPQP